MSQLQRYDFSSDGHYPSNSGGWVDADEAEAKISQLEQELAEAKKEGLEAKQDQARYQWLRNPDNQYHEDLPNVSDSSFNVYFVEDLDRVIDEQIAIKESK